MFPVFSELIVLPLHKRVKRDLKATRDSPSPKARRTPFRAMGRTLRIGRVRCRTETEDGSFRPSDFFVPTAASTTHFLPTVARSMRQLNRVTPVEGDPTLLPTVWTMDDRMGDFLGVSTAQEDCMVCPKLLTTSCDDVLFDVVGGTYVEAGGDRVVVPAWAPSDTDEGTHTVEGMTSKASKRARRRSATGYLWLHSSWYPLTGQVTADDVTDVGAPPPAAESVQMLFSDRSAPRTRTIDERCRLLCQLRRLQQFPSAVDQLPIGEPRDGRNGDDLLDAGSYLEWLRREQELTPDMSVCRDTGMFSSLPTYRSVLDSVFLRRTPEFPHRLVHLGDHFSLYHDAQDTCRFESYLPTHLQLRSRRRMKRARGVAVGNEFNDGGGADAATASIPPIQTSEAVMAELFRGASLQIAPVGFPISYLFETDVSVDDVLLLRTYRTLSLRVMGGWLEAVRKWTGCSEHVLWKPIDLERVVQSDAQATEALRETLEANRSKIRLPPHSKHPGIIATLLIDDAWCVVSVVGKPLPGHTGSTPKPLEMESTLYCAEPRGGDDAGDGAAATAAAYRMQYQARLEQARQWMERLFQRSVLPHDNVRSTTPDASRRTVHWPKRTDEVTDTSTAALAEATKILLPQLSHASVMESVSRPHVEYVALASPRSEAASRLWQVLPMKLL